MTPLEHVVDQGYEYTPGGGVTADEPRWMAQARQYVDKTVGRPLGKLGLFAADSRRRRAYLRENMTTISGVSKVGALTGAGSQPNWALDVIDEYVDGFDEQTGWWSDGIGSFDADDISRFHTRIVDPLSASSTLFKGSGSMFALHQLGVPAEYAAKGVGAALIGKGVQAGVRNYVLDAYDEHTVAPFNFLMSPSPWAWLGAGAALKAVSYATEKERATWDRANSTTAATASHSTPWQRNEASINENLLRQKYET